VEKAEDIAKRRNDVRKGKGMMMVDKWYLVDKSESKVKSSGGNGSGA
jgi:hypothetical protein